MIVPTRRNLPIGIQTFREIIEGGYYYVDKTGMAAEARWDGSRKFPVIRVSFAEGVLHSRQALDAKITEQLDVNQEALGLTTRQPPLSGRFSELIRVTHAKYGQRVVVLVDEYDKPILDNITDSEIARDMRDGLRDLYSVIKGQDASIKFAILTGVSKFSEVSLFSGLNNLNDITISSDYSALCGYTDADVDTISAPELPGLNRDEIRRWYNGYNWTGASVYNPFDLLLVFQKHLGRIVASETLLSTFDVDQMTPEALLFQTGYLTIASVWTIPGRQGFTLKYPRLEVQSSLNNSLLQALSGNLALPGPNIGKLYRLLLVNDFAGIQALIAAFYASIPNEWFANNKVAQYEGYYASVFYSYFAALGLDIVCEESSNAGRLDMAIRFNQQIYLFEFKGVERVPEGRAMQQIKDKGYADKCQASDQPIHLVGVEFSKLSRSVVGFEVETLQIE